MEDNGIIAGYVCISVFRSIAGVILAVIFEVRPENLGIRFLPMNQGLR